MSTKQKMYHKNTKPRLLFEQATFQRSFLFAVFSWSFVSTVSFQEVHATALRATEAALPFLCLTALKRLLSPAITSALWGVCRTVGVRIVPRTQRSYNQKCLCKVELKTRSENVTLLSCCAGLSFIIIIWYATRKVGYTSFHIVSKIKLLSKTIVRPRDSSHCAKQTTI